MFFAHVRVLSWKHLHLLGALLALLALPACHPTLVPDPPAQSQVEHSNDADAEQDSGSERTPDFHVGFRVSARTAASLTDPGSGFQLTTSFIEFSVRNCVSGYTLAGISSAQDSLQLYRFDQACKVWIDGFALEGEVFTPMPGHPFNPNVNSENQFLGDEGRILIVRVIQQLPQILDTPDANVSFLIVEKSLGRDFNILIHPVGLISSSTVLVESGTATVPVTVRRGRPAQGPLKVGLQISGTASPLIDVVGIPAEVNFQDGVSEITFNIRALTDDPYDDLETLQISINPGSYFIVEPTVNFNVRDQSHRPPVWTKTVGAQVVQDDATLTFTVTASDPDTDPVYYSIDTSRTTCTSGWLINLSISQSGVVSGVPGDEAVGNCLLALQATSLGGMITLDVPVTVLDRPENPVWTELPGIVRVYEGESLDVTFKAVDPDPGASISYSIDPSSTCLGYAWNPEPTLGSSSGRLEGRPATATGGRCSFLIRAQSQGTIITTEFQLEIARRTLVWSGPSGTPTNICVPLSLTMTDGLDQFIDAPYTASINLLVNNGTGTFYSNSNCTSSSAISSFTWPAGIAERSLYFRATTSNQNLTLVAQGGSYEPGFFNIAVASSASKLLLSGSTKPVLNQCVKYRVDQANSSNVKVISNSNRTVSFTLSNGLRAYSDDSCSNRITSTSIPAYETGRDFYVQATSTGNRTIRASSSGLSQAQLAVQVVTTRSWWNANWNYRLTIQLENSDQSTTFTNQPVLIKLTPERFPYSEAKADGSDLRFINSTDSTILPHQIEQWVPGGTSLIWVRVDQIPASSALGKVLLYFGNATATQAEQPAALWSTYTSVWHLNESPVATAPQFKDSTANGRHGRAVGDPQSLQGPVGNSISFMGSLDHIEITGVDLAPILGRTATFSAWVKTAQTGSNIGWSSPSLTGVEHNGTTNDIQWGWLDDTGRIGVTAGDTGAAKSNFVVNDSTWRHVTITRNESTGAVAFYVNGVQSGTGTSESGFKSTSFNRFGVLWDTSGTHRDFDGYMDEIRIQTGLMSADRIRADYKYMVDTHCTYLEVEEY